MTPKSTLRIISIIQARVDAFLKDIFDMCGLSEDSATAKSISDTIATEIAIYKTVEAAIRRRRNERILFSRLATDIVHSIFGIVLDVDRIHDPDLPLEAFGGIRHQIGCMRRVSSLWNSFLLSSQRYWQAIDIARPAKAIASVIERSGSAPLCIFSSTGSSQASSIRLVPAARVQTLRSDETEAYHLYRHFLQNPMPVLQTLKIPALHRIRGDHGGALGNSPSIHHLEGHWWKTPADAVGLTGLKELDLWRNSQPSVILLQILSACTNLENLEISSTDELVVGELPGAISPITLPRLRSIRLTFQSNESMVELTRRLVAPQCLRRTLRVEGAESLSLYIADYRRFMSVEETCIGQHPEFADVLIDGRSYRGTQLEYKAESRQVSLIVDRVDSVEEVPAFHDLVQELQTIFNGPLLTATVRYRSEQTWLFLKSLGDQKFQTIVAYLAQAPPNAVDFLKAIGTRRADLPSLDGPVANSATGLPFNSLKSIEILDLYSVNLVDLIGLVEEYLDKDSKPLLTLIVFVYTFYDGMELDQAVKRLEEVGITLRLSTPEEYFA